MQNVVRLASDHPRPRRPLVPPRSGARILFFTGVRYVRDEDAAPPPVAARDAQPSGLVLDAAAHC